jgi:hypothetical protein
VASRPLPAPERGHPVFFRFFYWTGFAFTYIYLELAGG